MLLTTSPTAWPCGLSWPDHRIKEELIAAFYLPIETRAQRLPTDHYLQQIFWQQMVRGRDGRVAEGARLESVFTRKGNVGSNPTLSASSLFSMS